MLFFFSRMSLGSFSSVKRICCKAVGVVSFGSMHSSVQQRAMEQRTDYLVTIIKTGAETK